MIELKGQVRFTGFNIQGSSFEKGAVGIYEDLGKFTIGVERPGKAFKKYKVKTGPSSQYTQQADANRARAWKSS